MILVCFNNFAINMNKSDNTKTDKSEDKSIPESKKDTDSQAL